ncbi:MAG TPA: bifunctional UDP-N-acetylglucosamine diphosphorylase/glucosamine-1-phosphate N-acetyltransferase GlmU [Candidatus Sulfotelmatobacter sp.]|nr:bifunctional UDP-N-acetylglucosamine diphosphorylase/glucosamine-1-phosphate N-acetyltransferase GlmU [Candidatus Sulfotelmatobacter sp.]
MREICGLILAAGEGTRMRSSLAKVLHPLGGTPMILWVAELCRRLPLKRTLIVVGYQADRVRAALDGEPVEFVHQAEQRGTAHAVLQAQSALSGFEGDLLVLSGDVPLLSAQTANDLLEAHRRAGAQATFMSTRVPDPTGYGRVIRGPQGAFLRIVEEVEATPEERRIAEINAGIYCFACPLLFQALGAVGASAVKGEHYLPEVVSIFRDRGLKVQAVPAPDPHEVLGVNTRIELAQAYGVLRRRVLRELMADGVTVLDPEATHVAPTARIGRDTVLYPGVFVEGRTVIGEGCTLYPNCRVKDAQVGNRVTILDGCVVLESEVGDECTLGPYAHLRPATRLRRKVKIGNFVETKKSVIGEGSKVPHLTYVGDASVGEGVNIGAGTITCNYDGVSKHQTAIEDGAFVGTNTSLVAPVRVGKGAIVAAGSTITQDVPPDAIAFGRAQQVNKPARAAEWRRRAKQAAGAGGKKPDGGEDDKE